MSEITIPTPTFSWTTVWQADIITFNYDAVGNRTSVVTVSHFQGDIDWKAVKAAGIRFAYLKASEGVSIQDQKFQQNRAGCKANNIPCGAYHFFRAKDSVAPQVDLFVSTLGRLRLTISLVVAKLFLLPFRFCKRHSPTKCLVIPPLFGRVTYQQATKSLSR